MKTLEDLKIIEERADPQNHEKRLVLKASGESLNPKSVTPLVHPPILVTDLYGQFRMIERSAIPEEANALLLGQKTFTFGGGNTREIYPASYCRIKGPDETPKRYELVECNHRICDCHMGESPKGKFIEFKE